MKFLLLAILSVVISLPNAQAADYENASILKLEAHPTRGMGVKFTSSALPSGKWVYLDINSTQSEIYKVWVSMMLSAYTTKQKVDIYTSTTQAGLEVISVFEIKDPSDNSIH